MSATIYHVLAEADVTSDTLKNLLNDPRCKVREGIYDGKKLFDILLKEHGFSSADHTNDGECVWREDEVNVFEYPLPDGSTALGYLSWLEDKDKPRRAVLMNHEASVDEYHINHFRIKDGVLEVGYVNEYEITKIVHGDAYGQMDVVTLDKSSLKKASSKKDEQYRRGVLSSFGRQCRDYADRLIRGIARMHLSFEKVKFTETVAVPECAFSKN